MCYQQIHIALGGSSPNRLTDDGEILHEHNGFGIDVPCGHCEQCMSAKRDSYLIRCLSENERSFSRCFCTLTYDNAHLPYVYQHTLPVFSDDGELLSPPKRYKRSVWDKLHIQKFLKALNERIIYYVGTEIYGYKRLVTIDGHRVISADWKSFLESFGRPLKYLCVCERGKNNIYMTKSGQRRGTRRPHYHLIIFNSCEHIDDNLLLQFIKECWTYGLSYNCMLKDASFSNKRNIRQSLAYICKYVTKDFDDISNRLVYHDHKTRIRHTPFVLVSNFLGDNLLTQYDDSQLFYHLVHGITIGAGIFSKERVIPVPAYNKRKSKMYVTLSDGKHVSKRIADTEYFSDGYSVTFVDHFNEFQFRTYYKKYILLTDFGKRVRDAITSRKVYDLYNTFLQIRNDNVIYNSLSKHSLAVGSFAYLDYINSVNPDEFKLYVKSPYHESTDTTSRLYLAYLGVREYMSTLSRIQHYDKELDYNLNFEKVISKNPEYLCLQPL